MRLPYSMDDLVWDGSALTVYPAIESGALSYGNGRLFTPVGAEAASVLDYGYAFNGQTVLNSLTGTVALRCCPTFAGNDGASHSLLRAMRSGPATALDISKTNGNVWRAQMTDGTAVNADSPGVSWAANTFHSLVVRYLNGASGTLDFNYDGTNRAQVANVRAPTFTDFYVSSGMGNGNSYIGPVIISPVRKSDAWVTAIQTDSGRAFNDPVRLFKDFLSIGDLLVPLERDSRAYLKVGGGSPFDTTVLFDGDSLTKGTTVNATDTYPQKAAESLGYHYDTRNLGIGGKLASDLIVDASAKVDVLRNPSTKNIVVFWAGLNDINASHSAATLLADIQTYCAARRARGFKVVVCTITPSVGNDVPSGKEGVRTTVNTSLRANWASYADGLADIAGDGRIGDKGDEADTTYYNADQAHMVAAGYAIVAGIVAPVVSAL